MLTFNSYNELFEHIIDEQKAFDFAVESNMIKLGSKHASAAQVYELKRTPGRNSAFNSAVHGHAQSVGKAILFCVILGLHIRIYP